MKKIETIWHYLLNEALLKQSFRHTQQAGTVHHALQAPLELGAIRKESKFFILEDFKKLLYHWASVRRLERLKEHRELPEAGLNQHRFSQLKEKIEKPFFGPLG